MFGLKLTISYSGRKILTKNNGIKTISTFLHLFVTFSILEPLFDPPLILFVRNQIAKKGLLNLLLLPEILMDLKQWKICI